ncbi:hypothetical protein B0H11DRAFT_2222201 [Mycena galericulata]|nr:hypothetical protein B0H11DRAFT_2222201 [Mycena galericulata]
MGTHRAFLRDSPLPASTAVRVVLSSTTSACDAPLASHPDARRVPRRARSFKVASLSRLQGSTAPHVFVLVTPLLVFHPRLIAGTGGIMDHKQNVAGLEAVAEPEIIAPLIPQEPWCYILASLGISNAFCLIDFECSP